MLGVLAVDGLQSCYVLNLAGEPKAKRECCVIVCGSRLVHRCPLADGQEETARRVAETSAHVVQESQPDTVYFWTSLLLDGSRQVYFPCETATDAEAFALELIAALEAQ